MPLKGKEERQGNKLFHRFWLLPLLQEAISSNDEQRRRDALLRLQQGEEPMQRKRVRLRRAPKSHHPPARQEAQSQRERAESGAGKHLPR